jgi:hypothetical protein
MDLSPGARMAPCKETETGRAVTVEGAVTWPKTPIVQETPRWRGEEGF